MRKLWPFAGHGSLAIVRLLPLLDEADILECNLRWYADAGIPTVAFDNASTDGTREIGHAALEAGMLVAFEHSDTRLEWAQMSSALLALGEREQPDVVIVAGADEFLEVADGRPLRSAIEDDLARGHELLRVQTMEFCLTDEDDPSEPDPIARMRHYGPYRTALRDRGLRWSSGLEWLRPHELVPGSDGAQRSPRAYINRHYPLRSADQAVARAQTGRLQAVLAGSSAAALAPLVESERDLTLPARKLARYEDDHHWKNASVLADLRLASVRKPARRMAARRATVMARLAERECECASLKKQVREGRDLRKRYIEVLLDRDRLAAAGAQRVSGQLAASATWYDEKYRLTLDKYDSDPEESTYLPVWQTIAGRIDPHANVLEIGCGSGQLARLLIDRGLKRYRGFDLSEVAVELARRRLPEVEVQVADARTTSLLEKAGYDVALCTEVLEHLDDDVAVLRRIRPGTRVLATVPNFHSASHLRFFSNEHQVVERYAPALDELEVTRVDLMLESAIFVIDGVARPQRA